MYAPQFKQMSDTTRDNSVVEIFSFDRIAQTVCEAIYYQLVEQGWTPAAAVQFLQSSAIRHGLDQSLGMALEKAAEEWTRREAESWRNDCNKLAWSQKHNQTTGA